MTDASSSTRNKEGLWRATLCPVAVLSTVAVVARALEADPRKGRAPPCRLPVFRALRLLGRGTGLFSTFRGASPEAARGLRPDWFSFANSKCSVRTCNKRCPSNSSGLKDLFFASLVMSRGAGPFPVPSAATVKKLAGSSWGRCSRPTTVTGDSPLSAFAAGRWGLSPLSAFAAGRWGLR